MGVASVEFTKTRGCSHWHFLAKLPGVLDTAIFSRMVQDMHIVRTELKFSNITNYDGAWQKYVLALKMLYDYLISKFKKKNWSVVSE